MSTGRATPAPAPDGAGHGGAGHEELLVGAKIAVAHAIDEAEARIRAAVPIARVIYLEPDIRRAGD